ncbi:hypothetical protein [Piscinibacterium candidicorallinum]|uniref:ABC-type amino acid transport substrate-binding protein n=1 Tax=Piscinibacterium candidicorallinum TaxID=1793872 RepID=A0ABV7HC05_9BURK
MSKRSRPGDPVSEWAHHASRDAARRDLLRLALSAAVVSSGGVAIGAPRSAAAAPAPAPHASSSKAPIVVRMNGGADANDQRTTYPQRLLALAMERSGEPFRIVTVASMTVPRRIIEMQDGHLDLCVLASTMPPQRGIRPIRLPLQRGLLGVRLLLATPEVAERVTRVSDLSELKRRYRYGSGLDWADRGDLERLGFRVVAGASYSGLFDMLRNGRFDIFSRGITEIYRELDHPQLGRGLAVVPSLVLHYPLDSYFHVSERSPRLYTALERGLRRARQDGSMTALLASTYGAAIQRANLAERRWLRVQGYPVLPGTPLELFDLASPAAAERLLAPGGPRETGAALPHTRSA